MPAPSIPCRRPRSPRPLSELLSAEIDASGLPLAEIARRAGTSTKIVRAWLTGETEPRPRRRRGAPVVRRLKKEALVGKPRCQREGCASPAWWMLARQGLTLCHVHARAEEEARRAHADSALERVLTMLGSDRRRFLPWLECLTRPTIRCERCQHEYGTSRHGKQRSGGYGLKALEPIYDTEHFWTGLWKGRCLRCNGRIQGAGRKGLTNARIAVAKQQGLEESEARVLVDLAAQAEEEHDEHSQRLRRILRDFLHGLRARRGHEAERRPASERTWAKKAKGQVFGRSMPWRWALCSRCELLVERDPHDDPDGPVWHRQCPRWLTELPRRPGPDPAHRLDTDFQILVERYIPRPLPGGGGRRTRTRRKIAESFNIADEHDVPKRIRAFVERLPSPRILFNGACQRRACRRRRAHRRQAFFEALWNECGPQLESLVSGGQRNELIDCLHRGGAPAVYISELTCASLAYVKHRAPASAEAFESPEDRFLRILATLRRRRRWDRVKAAVKRQGLTLRAVAFRARVSRPYIHDVMDGVGATQLSPKCQAVRREVSQLCDDMDDSITLSELLSGLGGGKHTKSSALEVLEALAQRGAVVLEPYRPARGPESVRVKPTSALGENVSPGELYSR